jgi:hypothetical protein
MPLVLHVKTGFCAFALSNEPLGADQEYASMLGLGPVAVDVRLTGYPTFTSAGLAAIDVTVPQLNVLPLTSTEPESGAAALHCRATETFVVVWATELKVADPVHVTVLSVVVPVSEMR